MIELARQYGRYGYRRISALLRDAGWQATRRIGRMTKIAVKIAAVCLFVLLELSTTTQSRAGELKCVFACEIRSFGSNIDWESTDCSKPYTPSLFVTDVESFNWAAYTFNRYVSDAQNYINCLVNEAEGDLRELPEIISKGVERARSEMVHEVDSHRSELELQRTLLR